VIICGLCLGYHIFFAFVDLLEIEKVIIRLLLCIRGRVRGTVTMLFVVQYVPATEINIFTHQM